MRRLSRGASRITPAELASDTARFPDEEPEPAPPDPVESDARKIMEILDDHAEELTSQIYLDLANLTQSVAKTERRAARMRKRILEEDGSDASCLVPSDIDLLADEDALDGMTDTSDAVSFTSTVEDDIEVEDPTTAMLTWTTTEFSKSAYLVKASQLYGIPRSAILRNKAKRVVVRTHDELERFTTRGGRGAALNDSGTGIDPSNIVVVQLMDRAGDMRVYWGVRLRGYLYHPHEPWDRVVHLLPHTTVSHLVARWRLDSLLSTSVLLSAQYLPTVEGPPPIPGRGYKRFDRAQFDVGNGLPKLPSVAFDMPPEFVFAPQFTGGRRGMVFKNGPRGVGYYRDITRSGRPTD